MDIIKDLQKLNLDEREAKVYLALLESGATTPLAIANKTGLKRPTVYLVLEDLRRKQLAGLTFKGKKTFYTADPPSRFLRQIREQEQTALELLPLLKAFARQAKDQPVIRYYDHREDMEKVWLEEIGYAKQNDFMSNHAKWLEHFPNLFEALEKKVGSGEIQKTRGLISHDDVNLDFLQEPKRARRHMRVIPSGYHFNYDLSLWENNVALYSFEHRYMLVITDEALAEVFHAIFEIIWSVSLTAEDYVKQKKIKLKKKKR
jgi:sugar-specific transcriptional regulator TrmB